MPKKIYRNKDRDRKLTRSEASRLRSMREKIEREIPPVQPDAMRVAIAKLRALRESQGVSLSQLSERTGITRGNIARLESQKNATLKTLERYAEGLGCVLEINIVSWN